MEFATGTSYAPANHSIDSMHMNGIEIAIAFPGVSAPRRQIKSSCPGLCPPLLPTMCNLHENDGVALVDLAVLRAGGSMVSALPHQVFRGSRLGTFSLHNIAESPLQFAMGPSTLSGSRHLQSRYARERAPIHVHEFASSTATVTAFPAKYHVGSDVFWGGGPKGTVTEEEKSRPPQPKMPPELHEGARAIEAC